MIDRLEILVSRLRYLVSRSRWSARLLGARPVEGHADDPGLVLVQIDGLGEQVLRRALREGRLPFLAHLLTDEAHHLHSLYSGMPSNTPGFQAELFWGEKGAVPGFGFVDPEIGRPVSMTQQLAASTVERRLGEGERRGLLSGGSSWSNIFAGGAAEAHFCCATTGLRQLGAALHPLRVLGLVLFHFWSVVRVFANLVAETLLALWDFMRGAIAGRDLRMELRFVPERVLVSAVLREIVTAGACVDAARGLPIIHLNFLGYDEHSHRRGPDSRFALWALRGIDRSVRRVWLAAHRSRHRDYRIWIYSDHGQERVQPWETVHGVATSEAILRVFRELHPRVEGADAMEPTIVHRGTIGFVYLPASFDRTRRDELAEAIAHRAKIPTVLVADGANGARVWTMDGSEYRLPGDAAKIFGPDHPQLDLVEQDALRTVYHRHAGEIVFWSWNAAQCYSFKREYGAHGGPGPRETAAFLVLPSEASALIPPGRTLRPLDLRELALGALDPRRPRLLPRGVGAVPHMRIVTYNVHGCRGMDGRFSVERITRVLARAKPDVVCLQELDQRRPRSGGFDQAHEIADRLAKSYSFHAVSELDDGRFGNAVLSSHPMQLVEFGPLPAFSTMLSLEPRGVLWVEVLFHGIRFQVLNTHLSILERERRIQVVEILRWVERAKGRGPVILCGDLNTSSDSWVGRRLAGALHDLVRREAAARATPAASTWSGRIPMRRIDHIFASEGVEVASVDVPRSRLARIASDHLPVIVDLGVDGAKAEGGRSPATGGFPVSRG